MVSLKNDHKSAAPTKNNPNVQCNLDMKVTVSRLKKGGTRKEKARNIFYLCTLIFVIIIMINVYINVRKFQLQMDKLNYNVVQLTRQYDKLNRIMNRKYSYKIIHSHDFVNVIKYSDHELSNLSEVNGSNDKFDIYSTKPISPIWNQSIYHQDVIETNSTTNLNHITSLTKSENISIVNFNKTQYFPRKLGDLQTSEIQNLAIIKNKKTDADVLSFQNELTIKRLRRSIEKPEKRQQRRRRPNRNHKQSDPLVVTFIGAIPEQRTDDTAKIGPWKENTATSNPFDFNKFHLADNQMSIEVTMSGLYIISVQIFYYGELQKYSFNVLLNSEGVSNKKTLVTCVTAACNVTGTITCYTSITAYLQKGDRLSIQQSEDYRFINLREGYSHVQLVMLAKDKRKRIRLSL